TTGMLRAAYAYCGLPAFVSLSMAGSDGGIIKLLIWRRPVAKFRICLTERFTRQP
ncbi:MAG: hypothetical protein FE835_19930, partial [Gammaproteobacteria bacterium]|nr:hypothetical protein [Gammaproteobacteria bacterium]